MYVLTSPPRLLNRIQPNFSCPLGVTMADGSLIHIVSQNNYTTLINSF